MHLQNVRRILHAAIFSLSVYPFVRPSVRPSVQGAVAIKMPDFLAGARVSRCREEGTTTVVPCIAISWAMRYMQRITLKLCQ